MDGRESSVHTTQPEASRTVLVVAVAATEQAQCVAVARPPTGSEYPSPRAKATLNDTMTDLANMPRPRFGKFQGTGSSMLVNHPRTSSRRAL